ncbi:MAG: hypothetical protein NTV89_11355 [Proteobacteria bacterium]|nr:hypothetical protein [Pseudomonadota bacterium]
MRTLYRIFLSTIVICASASYTWAGAWSANQGGLYAKLSYNHYYTNYTFTDGGGTQRLPKGTTFTDNNTALYLEYGITDRLTISGSLPYKWLRSTYRQQVTVGDQIKTRKVETRWNGFGDMELGLKYCFLKEPVVTSVQFLYKNAWLYDKNENIPPGNHQDDYELRFLAGKSLWPFPGYCGAEIGYRWRTQAPSDEFRYLLEFGINATRKLSFRVKLDGTKSMHNADLPLQPKPVTTAYIDEETGQVIKTGTSTSSQAVSANPSLGLQYDLGKLEFTTSYQVAKRWFCELSYTNYPYGKNVSPGDQYSCALVYYFDNKKSPPSPLKIDDSN